jgi:hypothetical protein
MGTNWNNHNFLRITFTSFDPVTGKGYRQYLKHVTIAAFESLKKIQSEHTKVKNINYQEFKLQKYMSSSMFTKEEVAVVYNLREKCTKMIQTVSSGAKTKTHFVT